MSTHIYPMAQRPVLSLSAGPRPVSPSSYTIFPPCSTHCLGAFARPILSASNPVPSGILQEWLAQSHHTGLHLQVSSERPLKPSAPFTPHSRSGLPSRVTTGPKDRGCQCELIIIVLQQPGMAGEVLPKELKKSSIYSCLEVWQDSRVPALHARSPQLYPTIP